MQASCPITYVKTFADRLLEAMAEAKMSQTDLALAAGYTSQGAIGNAISRNTPPKKLRQVAIALGVREEWLETGSLPKRVAELAHAVSQDSVTVAPQRDPELVPWGELGMRELPEAFAVEVPDDAMAPIIRRGMRCEFKKLHPDVQLTSDHIVLLHDVDENWYVRHYVPQPRKRWQAAAENAKFGPPMDSERDGLTVIAVLTKIVWPQA